MLIKAGKYMKIGGCFFTTIPASIEEISNEVTIAAGSTLFLYVSGKGTAPLSYSWTKDVINTLVSSTSFYTLSNTPTSASGLYRATVSNNRGSETSDYISVNILNPVSIVSQTSAISAQNGSVAKLEIEASGSTPISYSWFKDGSTLTGSTSSYFIYPVGESTIGTYYCILSNAVSTLTSDFIGVSAY